MHTNNIIQILLFSFIFTIFFGISSGFAQITHKNVPFYRFTEDSILLIHPSSRELALCSSNKQISTGVLSDQVKRCAKQARQMGFVPVTDLPRFTASDDQIVYTNYPSRRFRGQDLTPRW